MVPFVQGRQLCQLLVLIHVSNNPRIPSAAADSLVVCVAQAPELTI